MEYFYGKTVESAIEAGLNELGINKDDAIITVVEEGSMPNDDEQDEVVIMRMIKTENDCTFEMIEDDWLVVMEPETEDEIRERAKREREKEQKNEEEKHSIDIPFEDPAQMKLWD